jgi:hypothetical protein
VGALRSDAAKKRFECDNRWRSDRCRRFKGYDVRNRTGPGCAAKRTVRELDVARVVVPVMCGHLRLIGCGTRFQQKRCTGGRHETHGHIRTKQEDDQQEAGHQRASAIVEKAPTHVLVASD